MCVEAARGRWHAISKFIRTVKTAVEDSKRSSIAAVLERLKTLSYRGGELIKLWPHI